MYPLELILALRSVLLSSWNVLDSDVKSRDNSFDPNPSASPLGFPVTRLAAVMLTMTLAV